MSEFTFLDEKSILGNDQLDILKKYGTKCAVTDFSILLGGDVSGDFFYTSEGNSRENHAGCWWTKSSDIDNDVFVVYRDGTRYWYGVSERFGGARPSLPYSSISSNSSNRVRGRNGILEVEYGEYPQTIVSESFARTLESTYSDRTINQTGKSYTTDSVSCQDTDTSFQARTHIEYEYHGKKYIRFVGDSNCSGGILSDGRIIQNGNVYWVTVEPIKWMIDEKTNIALSKKIIFSGVQFASRKNYEGDFNKSDIKKFMDTYFSKDIIPSVLRKKSEFEKSEKESQEVNLTKGDKIVELIEEIKKYLLPNDRKEEILKQIETLVDKYNEEIEKIKEKTLLQDESVISPFQTKEVLYNNLFLELSTILDEVKAVYNNKHQYYQILDIIDKAILIFEGQEVLDSSSLLLKDLYLVKNQIISNLLVSNTLNQDIVKVLLEEKKEIEELLNDSNSKKYKTVKDWELGFRKKFQLILFDIQKVIRKQEVNDIISTRYNTIMSGNYSSYVDELVQLYLKDISDTSNIIKCKTNDERYLKRLEEIVSEIDKIDYSKSLEEVINQISQILISLYKLEFEIDEINKEIGSINDYKVNLKK